MRDNLPVGHRVFRPAVLAVLVAAAVTAGAGETAAAAAGAVVHQGARLARSVWEPLLTGGGWVEPLLPSGSPSPSAPPAPQPSAAPLPAKPATPVPTVTKKR